MGRILDSAKRLYPFPYSVTGKGNDAALPVWQAALPFSVHEFPSGAELNGWRIPPAWTVDRAEIRKGDKLIYDGTVSPLGVIALSESFTGKVTREELKKHLFYSDESDDAIVYHWTALYRPRERNWGFCIPKRLYDSLTPATYYVDLLTRTEPGTMKVLDYLLLGASSKTVLLNGHNCHPFQANDDISGCAVGIEVMKRLAALPSRRFSYRLVVAPELIGTVFWLDSLGEAAADIECTIMLKSVGNDAPLKLQESFTGVSLIDRAARHVFQHRFGSYQKGGFRTIYGNDETVFEAPGFEIPSISLTRFPFHGYHTDLDTPDRLSSDRLDETADVATEICLALERNLRLQRCFKGLVCLSHPDYDLYRNARAPGIERGDYSGAMGKWNLLMNCLPRHLDGKTGLLEIAERYEVPLAELHAYALQWVKKGLAKVQEDKAG